MMIILDYFFKKFLMQRGTPSALPEEIKFYQSVFAAKENTFSFQKTLGAYWLTCTPTKMHFST